ncbi:MAG: V-type ATPase subunit [Asgard group archaeon]|nr:V-type ATPase subunit [Asgard group archaeon]
MPAISSTIPFLIAKAHAYHASAPTHMQIQAMLNATKVSEIETILQSTGYSTILNEVRPSVNLPDFEVAMRRDYAKLLNRYQIAASPDIADLLHAYAMRIEAENMDLILQAILRGNVSEELLKDIIPVGKFGLPHYKRMMEITKAEVATDFIIFPKLRKAAQEALMFSDDVDEQTFYLSSALSHASFQLLQEVAPRWIRKEIEFLNLETVARSIKLGIDPEPWMIPNNGIVNRYTSILSSMNTPREALSFMLPHFPVSAPIEIALQSSDDDLVSVFEDHVLSYLFHQHHRNFNIYGNQKESILDFFSIKKAEIEDLSRILLSKIKGIPSEKIQGMLMPIYRR